MIKNLLLIDFENIQKVDLTLLNESLQVMIFVGASQKSVPIALVTEAQKLGKRVEWHRVDAHGSNALDFLLLVSWVALLREPPGFIALSCEG